MEDLGDNSPLTNLPGNDIDDKFCSESTATSIRLVWENPDIKFEYFDVRYKEDDGLIKKFDILTPKDNGITIEELKSNTRYDIIVHTVVDGIPSLYLRRKCKTLKSFAEELKKAFTCTSKPDKINTYDMNAKEHVKSKYEGVQLCEFWHGNDLPLLCDASEEKTIMFVGATGSGKSTLINVLINYIADVPFADDYRFALVTESDESGAAQLQSTTSDITCYKIHYREGLNLNCKILNVIDTPGFNDTRGKSHDEQFPKKLNILLAKVIDSVDAVCVVLPMTLKKLTDEHKYVLNSIFDLFGKDIKSNIFPFITFDDGGPISCQHALETFDVQVESDYYFRFTNSDVFLTNQSIDKWKSRRESFNRFFKALSFVQKGSLKESKNVLNTRISIRIQLKGIQSNLIDNIIKVNNVRALLFVLRKCRDSDMIESKATILDEFERVVHHAVSVDNCTNCTKCKFTCHKRCYVIANMFKVSCKAFGKSIPVRCMVCSGKCESSSHIVERKEYKYGVVKKSKSIEDIKKKYKLEQLDLEQLEPIIKKEEAELKMSLSALDNKLKHIQTLINKLEEIALHHDKNGLENYLTELIKTEIRDQLSGFEDRVKMLGLVIDAVKKGSSIQGIVDQLV